MKEFQTNKGGRVLYNEDFYNLQELIESNTALFQGGNGNFVISGCTKDSSGNVEGYVWLDKKVRKLEKTNISNMSSPAIIASNKTYTDTYEDGNRSTIMTDYGCTVIDLSKTSTSQSKIAWDKTNGFGNVFDSFLGNYMALLKSDETQNIQKDLKVTGSVEMSQSILKSGNNINITSEKLSDGSIKLSTSLSNGYWIVITPSGDILFYHKNSSGAAEALFAFSNSNNSCKLQANSLSAYNIITKEVKLNSLINSDIADRIDDINKSIMSTDYWYNVINYKDNSKVTNLQCKIYNGVVYIQGTLPLDFCDSSTLTDSDNCKISNYGLPSEIQLPVSDVEFDVVSPQTAGIGITVRIMRSGTYARRFYFDANAYPSGIADGYNLKYQFAPSVAWQYMTSQGSFNYDVKSTEEFVAYTYNKSGDMHFIAYCKITQVLTNKTTGKTSKNISWSEAAFVGSVHQGNSAGNYCSTNKSLNNDKTYTCGCANGTLYFRSALDSSKLYSQTCFSDNTLIANGVSTKIGDYTHGITIKKSSGSVDVSNGGYYSVTPGTDKIIIKNSYNTLSVVSGNATETTPPLYMKAVGSAASFSIESGSDLLTQESKSSDGTAVYAIKDFASGSNKYISIYFSNYGTVSFYIKR